MTYDVPACAPLLITKAKPKKPSWVTKDPVGGNPRLKGPWIRRMHKSESECKKQFSTDGEPKIARSGQTHKIAPDG
jgi:hypothetical protein